jgi:Exonuclease
MNAIAVVRPDVESEQRQQDAPVEQMKTAKDVYFSADVETDGPIPGPYSMLSFAMVFAGVFNGRVFTSPANFDNTFYRELRPISENYQQDALRVNGLDRDRLLREGGDPVTVMTEAARWIRDISGKGKPILVAYPLSFDWSWLYWYFTKFAMGGSPFNHSLCYDVKTAYAVKAGVPISQAGRSKLLPSLRAKSKHTHNALDDAKEQAEVFATVFRWEGKHGATTGTKT